MKLFDQYLEAVKVAFPDPSPAMAAYINGLETIEQDADQPDMGMAVRAARWGALTEDEQIACQTIAATL